MNVQKLAQGDFDIHRYKNKVRFPELLTHFHISLSSLNHPEYIFG